MPANGRWDLIRRLKVKYDWQQQIGHGLHSQYVPFITDALLAACFGSQPHNQPSRQLTLPVLLLWLGIPSATFITKIIKNKIHVTDLTAIILTLLLSFHQAHTRSAPPLIVYTVCCALLYLDSSATQALAIPSWDRVRRTLSSWLTVRWVIRRGILMTSEVAGLISLRIAVDRARC